ncbi:MAG: GNAT family N-acetyltransferase [Bacteroidota bacterium]
MDLISDRLVFKRMSSADFPFYSSLVMNGEVMKYITGKSLSHEEAIQRFQAALYAGNGYQEAGFFIAETRLDTKLIGVVKLVRLADQRAEIGYMLLPQFWGKGFASEMVERMIILAKEKKLAAEIIGIIDPSNPASIRVLTKFGFCLYDTGQIDGLDAAYYKLELLKLYSANSKKKGLVMPG